MAGLPERRGGRRGPRSARRPERSGFAGGKIGKVIVELDR
jgi:hypothetical protein